MPMDKNQTLIELTKLFYLGLKDSMRWLWTMLENLKNGNLDAPKGKVSGSNPDGGAILPGTTSAPFTPAMAMAPHAQSDDKSA